MFKKMSIVLACIGICFLTACTGKSDSNVENKSAAILKTPLPVGDSHCPTGGVSIDAGIDSNGNGVLDPSEITSTQYVCNGDKGVAALRVLTA